MVRLVFRPYTHVRRTICTSASLRASTRVSPGFTLHTHSSPSFGSQRMCSRSDPTLRGLASAAEVWHSWHQVRLRYAFGFDLSRHLHIRWTPWSVLQDGSNWVVVNKNVEHSQIAGATFSPPRRNLLTPILTAAENSKVRQWRKLWRPLIRLPYSPFEQLEIDADT